MIKERAIKEIDRLFPLKVDMGNIKGLILWNIKDGRFKALRAVKKLANGAFYYNVDENIGRFHSNLTNIKKDLRKYISYNRERLVNAYHNMNMIRLYIQFYYFTT